MCKLITVIKKNNKNDKIIIKALQAQEKIVRKEPHGISALAVDKNNKVKVKKSIDNYGNVLNWAYGQVPKSKIISIHSRQATSGYIDRRNLHFFRVDGYYLAHNGITGKEESGGWGTMGSSYSEREYSWVKGKEKGKLLLTDEKGKEEEIDKNTMCDSYRFLCNILKPIQIKDIDIAMKEEDFYGIGMIIDSNKNRLYTFGTRVIPVHTNLKDYAIYYSFDPSNKIKETKKFMGFEIRGDKESEIKLNREIIEEGIYRLDY